MKNNMNKKNRNKAGHIETLVAIGMAGIIAGLIIPPVDIFLRTPKVAERYATQRYGDHKAPLTDAERAEWYSDMHIKPGEKPTLGQLYDFRENYKNNVFF